MSDTNLPLIALSLSHRDASAEQRAVLALSAAATADALSRWKDAGVTGFLLATCQRTELYVREAGLARAVAAAFGDRGAGDVAAALKRSRVRTGLGAVRHLFRVAAGLESSALGETEILGQVRRAVLTARMRSTLDPLTHRLADAALFTGKRVRRDTRISAHGASLVTRALDAAESRVGSLAAARVVVIGTGALARLIVRALDAHGVQSLRIVGRTPAHVSALASASSAGVVAWEELGTAVRDATVVIACAAASSPPVTADMRAASRALFIDLSMPRGIERAPGDDGDGIVDLDTLASPTTRTDALDAAIVDAEAIVADEASRFADWWRARRTIVRRVAGAVAMTVGFGGYAQSSHAQGPSAPPSSAQAALIDSLRSRIDELDQRLRVLARINELAADSARTAARAQSVVLAGRDGFAIVSADSAFTLRLRGYVQADHRAIARAGTAPRSSVLLLRRVRPIIEASLYGRFDIRLMPDFGEGRVLLQDAYADVRVARALTIRAGKFKPPIGLERLQSATDLRFVERGLPTNLVPSRDIGAQISGEVASARLSYQAAIVNGVADLGNGDGDASSRKDYVARIVMQPLAHTRAARIADAAVGMAVSTGSENGTAAAPALASYRSPGQVAVFRYRADALADGRRARVTPQLYVNVANAGVLAELVRSTQRVRRGDSARTVEATSWQIVASWLLTGERASFRTIAPKHPFSRRPAGSGAFELAARYGELAIGANAFPWFADPAVAIRKERAWAAGGTWYLARGIKLTVDYEHTRFAAALGGPRRPPESLLVSRLHAGF